MSSPDIAAIGDAAMAFHKGEAGARERLLQLWAAGGEPIQLCALAHVLADTETDPARELEWDLRSLEAATGSRDAEDRDALTPEMGGFLPSIHLSVANGHRRLGDVGLARRHVAIAAGRIGVLPDDDYGKLIRGGLRRLQAALSMAS